MPRRTRPPARTRISRVAVIATMAGVIMAGAGAAVAVAATGHPQAEIDGVSVSEEELAFYLHAADRKGDGGEADIRAAARERLSHDRALLALAGEQGLTDIRGFDDMEAARTSENDERAQQLSGGEVVYGLTSFSAQEFASHTLAGLRSDLIDALGAGDDGELAVSDADVEAFFAAHEDEWAAGATTYRVTRLEIPASAHLGAADAAHLAAKGIAAAADRTPGAAVSTVRVDADWHIGDRTLDPDGFRELQALAPGESTAPLPLRGGWEVLRLTKADVDEKRALSVYADRIRAAIRDERVDALVDERADRQEIHIDQAAWDAAEKEGTE